MTSTPLLIKSALIMGRGMLRLPAPFRLRQAEWLLERMCSSAGLQQLH